MSVRTKVLSMVDVIMRVPPILVIDEILKIGMGLPTKTHTADRGDDGGTIITLQNQTFAASTFSLEHNNNNNINSNSSNSSTLNDTLIGSAANRLEYVINSSLELAIENASVAATTSGIFSRSFNILIDDLAKNTYLSDILSITSVKFFLCLLGILCALGVFLLWTRHLVMVYMFIMSLGLISLSHWSSVSALALIQKSDHLIDDILTMNVTRLLDNGSVACAILPHFAVQWLMGMLFAYVHLGPRYPLLQKSMPLIFTSPIILSIFPLKPHMIKYLPAVAYIVPLILTKITVWQNGLDIGRTVYNGYQFAVNFVANFGISALIENEWQRLNVPTVLRIFWTIRITQDFVGILMCNDSSTLRFLPTVRKLLVNGCETLSAVLGMTAIISALCHYIGKAFQWYLLTYENDEEKSLGTVSAVLFYILALQTGLTSLSPDKRFVRLCRNFCLLFTALLHFLHNIVSPILMSLSAARNPSRKRHFRALTVCLFLISAPVTLLFVLWNRHSPSTWLLAVTAFSVEVVVKVLVSLATYTLFLLDARRQSFWEKLDDYLYYVRAFGNSVEFCFGILLFFNGAWILIFESGGAIRAIMMCIHAYFNIWCEAHAGWSVFMKRRSAVHKISSLPEATPAQLQAFDDVCAICYQEMYSAKITRCRHYFHGVCLRKWLYVQDRCPLCHEIMMHTDRRDETEANSNRVRQHQDPMAALNRNEDNLRDQLPNASENIDSSQHVVSNAPSNNQNSNISTSSTATVVVAATAAGSRNAHSGLPILRVQD